MKTTPHQLNFATSQLQDVYAELEQEIFDMFVKRLNAKGVDSVDNTLKWQVEKLKELHLVDEETVKLVSKSTGIAKSKINSLFRDLGVRVYKDTIEDINSATGAAISTTAIDQVMEGYLKQTFLDLDNNVNQTLITTNHGETSVTKVYQQIIKETTANVLSGLKTFDRSLADTMYRWRDKGLESGFIDKGKHHWSLEAYARTVINTTTSRAFQAARDQAAEDNNIDTFLMSSHPASRPACAQIQGKTVTTRLTGFTAPESGEWFEPLDNHGWGEPGGTFGINCGHMKWPYIPGVNTNNQPQFKPDDAIKNHKIQQKQRGLEREIRRNKYLLATAEELGDDVGILKYKSKVRKYQSAQRYLINQYEFLSRDYSRERARI